MLKIKVNIDKVYCFDMKQSNEWYHHRIDLPLFRYHAYVSRTTDARTVIGCANDSICRGLAPGYLNDDVNGVDSS